MRKRVHPKFLGTIDDTGRLVLDDRERFDRYKLRIKGRVEVTMKPWRRRRSMPQNNYYWGVVIQILGDHFGYTPDEMHSALKWQFLRYKTAKLPTTRSTSDMTTVEFEDYLESVRQWAAIEFEVNIPLPNEVLLDEEPTNLNPSV